MHGTKSGMDVDLKFLETSSQLHGKHAHYVRTTNNFTIKHYAGDVTYSAGKFGESNKDALGKDLVAVLKTSRNKLVAHLYPEVIDYDDKKPPPTAGNRIRVQCQELVTALMSCSPHYVRCIKSNDHKQALTIDATRVQHQAKYLGLSENIKVRRAGFAYRAEFHRFLERFAFLSKKTYPEWVGTDKNGCKEILKAVQSKIPGMSDGEIQLGNSKVFVRQPETYFELEKLRENRLGDFVAVIQRAWRNYTNKKVFFSIQNHINKIYADAGKARRRDSVFRPYLGDYLSSLEPEGPALTAIRDGVFRIIDHYDDQENIVFADGNSWRVISSPSNEGSIETQQFILVLTNSALYIMENTSKRPAIIKYPKTNNSTANSNEPVERFGISVPQIKQLPKIILRRRIPLLKKFFQGVTLSTQADNSIIINVTPQERLATPAVQNWKEDHTVLQCPITGVEFGLFTRRHHCRASGGIYSNMACDFRQHLPDLGYYNGMERVSDDFIGLTSIDILEDVMLLCDKKSELVGHLTMYWSKVNGGKLPITFTSTLSLRVGNIPSLARSPNKSITIQPKKSIPDESFEIALNGNSVVITVPTGLSHEVVADRQKAKAARRKKAEIRRQKEEAARRERQAAKEEQRERERIAAQEQKRYVFHI
jgi:myosin-1